MAFSAVVLCIFSQFSEDFSGRPSQISRKSDRPTVFRLFLLLLSFHQHPLLLLLIRFLDLEEFFWEVEREREGGLLLVFPLGYQKKWRTGFFFNIFFFYYRCCLSLLLALSYFVFVSRRAAFACFSDEFIGRIGIFRRWWCLLRRFSVAVTFKTCLESR